MTPFRGGQTNQDLSEDWCLRQLWPDRTIYILFHVDDSKTTLGLRASQNSTWIYSISDYSARGKQLWITVGVSSTSRRDRQVGLSGSIETTEDQNGDGRGALSLGALETGLGLREGLKLKKCFQNPPSRLFCFFWWVFSESADTGWSLKTVNCNFFQRTHKYQKVQ